SAQPHAADIVRSFSRDLNDAAGGKAVVLVLDTLEEVHLRPQGDLRGALELLAQVVQLCPELRLILSGRYCVREMLGAAAEGLPPLREAEVRPFTPEEAERYLEELRGIEEPSIRAAIARKANGDP